MPPLGEPSGLSRQSRSADPLHAAESFARSGSPRVRSREFPEGSWQPDYAASYAAGDTSWLRIESQLQHMEELVDVPDIENVASSTVVVDAGSNRENLDIDGALIRASLVVANFDKSREEVVGAPVKTGTTTETGSAGRPPRPSKGEDAIAPLYSAGNRKRSLGVGPISYAGDEGRPPTDWPSSRRYRSSSPRVSAHVLPAEDLSKPPAAEFRHRSSSVENKPRHVSRPASATNKSDQVELQNLRDWNHTLAYELSVERSELFDTKTKCEAHAQEIAELQGRLRAAMDDTKEQHRRADDLEEQIRAIKGLREADLNRMEEEAEYRKESARARIQGLEELLKKMENSADGRLAASREKLHNAVAIISERMNTALQRRVLLSWRCSASFWAAERQFEVYAQRAGEAEAGKQEISNRLRVQIDQTEAKSEKFGKYRERVQSHAIRILKRRKVAAGFVEWRGVMYAVYILQRIVAYSVAHLERAVKRGAMQIWKSETTRWRRRLRADRVCALSFQKYCYRLRIAVFRAWRALRMASVRSDKKVLNIVFRCLYLAVAKSWNTWLDVVQDQKRLDLAESRITERRFRSDRFGAGWLSRLFEAWKIWVQRMRRLRVSGVRVLRRWFLIRIWSAFSLWAVTIKARRQSDVTNTKILRRLYLHCTCRAFNTWVDTMRSNRKLACAAMRVIRSWISRIGMKTFHAWLSGTIDQRRLRKAANKLLRRWILHSVWSAFAAWLSTATAKRRVLISVGRVLKHWTHFKLYRVFGTWVFGAKEAKRHSAVGCKVKKRWMHLKLAFALDTWMAIAKREQRVAAFSTRVLQHWLRYSLWRAFGSLLDATRRAQTEAERQEALATAAMRVIRRWTSRTCTFAFDAWAEAAAESRRLAAAHRRALQKWLRMGVGSAFNAWYTFWQSEVEQTRRQEAVRILASKVILRMAHVSLWRAFDTWLLAWEIAQEASERSRSMTRVESEKQTSIAIIQGDRDKAILLLGSRALRRWRRATLWKALDTWKFVSETQRAVVQLTTRVVRRWWQLCLWRAFDSWHIVWVDKKADADRERAVVRMASRVLRTWWSKGLSSAFHTWVCQIIGARQSRRLRSKVLGRWLLSNVCAAFDLWRDTTVDLLRGRLVLTRTISRWRQTFFAKAFDAWSIAAAVTKRQKALTSRAIVRWKAVGVHAAFSWWLEFVHANAADREILLRATQRWTRKPECRSFLTWKRTVQSGIAQKQLLLRIALRWLRVAISRAWQGWLETTRRSIIVRETMSRVLRRWQLRACTGAWSTWSESTHKSQMIKNTSSKIIQRWRTLQLSTAWWTWIARVDGLLKIRQLGIRVVRRWRSQVLPAALGRWYDSAKEGRRLRAVGQRVASRWRTVSLARCFDNWRDTAEWQQKAASKIITAARKWKNHFRHYGFQGWREAARSQRRLRKIASKIVSRWSRLELLAPWAQWQQAAHEQKRLAMIAARVVQRWMLFHLSSAWHAWAWCVFASHDRQAQAQHANLDKLLAKYGGRIRHVHAGKAFVSWKFIVQRTAKAYRLFQAALMRLQNGLLFACLNTWREHAVEQQRLTIIGSRIVAKWILGIVAVAFETWRSNVLTTIRGRRVAGKVIRRWLLRFLLSALHGWRERALKQRRLAILGSRIVAKWILGVVAIAFETWRSNVLTTVRGRRVAGKVIRRWLLRFLLSALHGWRERALKQRQMGTFCSKILKRLRNAKLANAFCGWESHAREQLRVTKAAARIILRWRSTIMAYALNTWLQSHDMIIKQRHVLRRSLVRWFDRLVYRAWHAWVDTVHTNQAEATLVARVVIRWKNRNAGTAFGGWMAHLKELKVMRSRMLVAINRWFAMRLYAAFAHWETETVRLQKYRTALLKTLRAWQRPLLLKSWNRWGDHVVQDRYLTQIMRKVVDKMQHLLGHRAFGTWQSCVAERTRIRLMLERVLKRWMRRALSSCLNCWIEHMGNIWHERYVASIEDEKRLIQQGSEENMTESQQRSQAAIGYAHAHFEKSITRLVHRLEMARTVKFVVVWRMCSTIMISKARRTATWCLVKWKAGGVARCFEALRHHARRSSIIRTRCKRILQKMTHLCTSKAYNCWWEVKLQLAAHRRTIQRVVRHWQLPLTAMAFKTWYKVASDEKENRLDQERARKIKLLDDRCAAKIIIVLDIEYNSIKGNENQFKALLIEDVASAIRGDPAKIHVLDLQPGSIIVTLGLEEGVCADRFSVQDAAFEIFRQSKDSNSALRLPRYRHVTGKVIGAKLPTDTDTMKQRHVRHCANVVRRMLHFHKALAFDSFHERVLEVRAKRARLRSIIQRMRHMGLATAFDRFHEMVARLKRQHDIVARTVARWHTPILAWCWEGWLEYMDNAREAKHKAGLEEARFQFMQQVQDAEAIKIEMSAFRERQKARRNAILARTIQRSLHLLLAAAFDTLHQAVTVLRRHGQALARVIGRWRAPGIYAVLDHWWMVTRHMAEMRQRTVRYLRRWLLGKQAVAFSTWAHNVVETIESKERVRKEERERLRDELRQDAAGVKMVYNNLCRVVWTAFNAWHKESSQVKHFMLSARKMLARWHHAARGRTLSGWVSAVGACKATRRRWHILASMRCLLKVQQIARAVLEVSAKGGLETAEDRASTCNTAGGALYLERSEEWGDFNDDYDDDITETDESWSGSGEESENDAVEGWDGGGEEEEKRVNIVQGIML